MSWVSEVAADSPLIWLRANDTSGTTATDNSGNSLPGTYVGSPTFGAAGATNDGDTAVTLNGTSQYIRFTSGSAADTALKAISGSFTLECLVKLSAVTGSRGLFDRYASGGSTVSAYLFYMISAVPRFIIRNSSNADTTLVATSGALSSGVWAHLVARYDSATGQMAIRVNGANAGSQAVTPAAGFHARTPELIVGEFVFGAGFLPGDLDEVLIYDHALSDARITAHYEAFNPPPVGGSAALSLSASATAAAPAGAAASLSLSAVGATGDIAAGTASLDLDASGTSSASLAATAALSLSASGSAVLGAAGTAHIDLNASAEAVAHYPTDTSNVFDGLDLVGIATITRVRATAPVPPGLTAAQRYDVAIPYPQPVMVAGRPT